MLTFVIIGALGTTTTTTCRDDNEIKIKRTKLQKTAIIYSAKIFKKVLKICFYSPEAGVTLEYIISGFSDQHSIDRDNIETHLDQHIL